MVNKIKRHKNIHDVALNKIKLGAAQRKWDTLYYQKELCGVDSSTTVNTEVFCANVWHKFDCVNYIIILCLYL